MPGRKKKPTSRKSQSVKSSKKPAKKKTQADVKSVNKRSIAALKDSKRLLNIVLDAAHMGVWEWDIKTNKLRWSGSIQELYLHPTRSFSDSFDEYMQVVHPEDRSKIINGLKTSLQLLQPYYVEHRVIRKDGSVRWLEAYGNVYKNKAGDPISMTGTVQDVTSRKLIEKERQDWKTRHELISTSAGLVIYDYDIVTGDIIWSGNSLDVLGYDPNELGNIDQWVKQIHPDDRQEAFDLLAKAQRELKPYDVYYRFEKKNGAYCYMHDRGFFIANSNGKALRMLGMMHDVTEQVKAQESLRESELRYRTLQEASFGGIGLHELGKIIDCNHGLCEMTGYPYSELIGMNGLNLVAPEWRDYVYEKIKSGYESTYDVEGVRKDGSRYFLEIRGKNIPYQDKKIRVTEFRDITERKRNEEKIMEQNAKLTGLMLDLTRKNKQLEDFTQIVSHNLRSPVGNILTLLSFLENASTEEERSEYLSFLRESATTTLGMLNELNDILKVKQNKNIERHELYFEDVFFQVQSMLNARITECGATVSFDFSKAQTVVFPPVYLESIMLNLLDNALKYHHPDRKPNIQFTSFVNVDGNVILEVTDNGLGINLERYGHQVFKLRKTFHHHPESRGIGLFMVKNQLDAMGGDINVSSEENVGTSFFVNFNKHPLDGD
jgi:PAS domain S-box-containing protein